MSAFKIKHKSGKYLSTSFVRYYPLYTDNKFTVDAFGINSYSINKALVNKGKVYSTKTGAERLLNIANKIFNNEFEIEELK